MAATNQRLWCECWARRSERPSRAKLVLINNDSLLKNCGCPSEINEPIHSSGCANIADCKNRPATCTALPKKHSDKAGPLGVRVPGRNTMGTALLGNTGRDGILGHQNPRTTGTGVHGEQKARAKSAGVNRASACHQAAEPIPDHGDIGGATDPYY